MSGLPERRTRPTIRCLRDDLRLELPTVDVDLGTLDHPLMDEARRVAPAAPQGQKRILAIDHPLVYRLRHGRWRGATWLEDDAARFWLLAGAHREAGSRDDAYEVFAALREAGSLLPDDHDRDRDVVERNARLRTAAIAALPVAVADAVMRREEDIPIRIADRVDMRLFVSAAGDEVWVAVATREADGSFIDEPRRVVPACVRRGRRGDLGTAV